MKAMLYLDPIDEPVAILDEVKVITLDSENHPPDQRIRIYYNTRVLNATDTMVELHRDRKMTVKLEDGRTGAALLAHSSVDAKGRFAGVLRILGGLA